jgi:serpin B
MKSAKKIFIIPVVVMVILLSCEETVNQSEPTPLELTAKSKMLIEADNAFGLELFRKVIDSEEESKNIMISPLSVSLALAMTYNGSDGTTRAAMEETLHLSGLSLDDINRSYKNLMEAMVSMDPKVIMEIANSIWHRNDFYVEEEFLNLNRTFFNADVTPLDFGVPESLATINNWVSENTHHKITKILDQIDPLDVMFLINAIYFKGIWTYQFDPESTLEMPFYAEDGSEEDVPFMVMDCDVEYFYNDLVQAVELPYGKGDFSMIVILPMDGKSVDDVLVQLTPENWKSWLEGFYLRQELEINLPKFRFEYEKSLKEVLSTLGMSVAFSPGEADFSRINPDFDLYISEVKHKTFIDVNEEGTEAAAVTSVTISLTSIGPPDVFKADKPFLFIIKENSSNAIIFAGKVSIPVIED